MGNSLDSSLKNAPSKQAARLAWPRLSKPMARPCVSRPMALWGIAIVGLLVSLYMDRPGAISGYWLLIIQIMGIYAILSMSLGLINGFTGQFSLGHAVFMGIGAYSSAILTSKLTDWPLLPALIVGGLLASVVALAFGIPVFRLKGDYVSVITLAMNLIFTNLLWNFQYGGGPSGFPGIRPDANMAWIWIWVVVTYAALSNLVFSTHGRAILSLREDEVAAPLVGIDIYRYKIISFTIACFFAGVAGGLYAHTVAFIAPASFTFFISIDILAMSLLGGTGSLFGAALGAIGLRFLFEALRFLGLWRLVIAPVVLVVVMIFRPSGLYGLKEPKFLRPQWQDEPIRPRAATHNTLNKEGEAVDPAS